jgi:predicted dehydrogenase
MELRAAIVGAGEQGGYHARAYRAVEGVRLVAVCDAAAERAAAFSQAHGLGEGAAFGSIPELAARHEIDVWSVCARPLPPTLPARWRRCGPGGRSPSCAGSPRRWT